MTHLQERAHGALAPRTIVSKVLRVFAVQKVAHCFSAFLVQLFVAAARGILGISAGLRFTARWAAIGKPWLAGS
jgi:hypothetical protein